MMSAHCPQGDGEEGSGRVGKLGLISGAPKLQMPLRRFAFSNVLSHVANAAAAWRRFSTSFAAVVALIVVAAVVVVAVAVALSPLVVAFALLLAVVVVFRTAFVTAVSTCEVLLLRLCAFNVPFGVYTLVPLQGGNGNGDGDH